VLPTPPAQAAAKPTFAGILSDLHPRHFITAGVVVVLAVALSRFVNLMFTRAIEHHRKRGTLLPETATQLHVARRLCVAAIWLVAGGLSLAQFPELRVLSTGLLASAGLSGLVVGFAARGTLGNAVAGLTIAFSQPIRIGDDIELRGERGVVEDIHLLFTVLRLGDGKRFIIPNDTLATEVVKNLTMGGVTRVARAEVLVPPKGDATAVRKTILAEAAAFDRLDKSVAPQVYWARIDERGTLLRLVATCTDGPAADELVQRTLARASQLVFRNAL
jgi:small-conductance mechanosensitive channel